MGAVYFYHLTRRPLEATLPMLLEKAVGAGWRCVVRGTDRTALSRLDEALWTFGKDSFLPHALDGGPHDAEQPILLTDQSQMAQCVMSVHGAAVSADDINASERTCILFDGNDPDALQHARGQWKSLTGAGVSAQYWSEESGRWEKKAET
ncbi:DNA polymerase III subunit chi [Nereida sp. MMG025]|uniref:DNA polymerase III subunit chi n=1 Tax=Nereida sp. MMG025 TaxID=2909981 RepID=UPI001EFF87AB|nr:DNA polymerase III subunit chi [Nereida sp. MMG025]MCF6443440.1 DNA polymerase III subunit chi [Nereida sp. MMG025]